MAGQDDIKPPSAGLPHLHMVWEAGEVVHAALIQGASPDTASTLQVLLHRQCICDEMHCDTALSSSA